VATKTPWPPVDGGRLLLWETLGALAAAGHAVSLVAPAPASGTAAAQSALAPRCRPFLVPPRRRPALVDGLVARLRRRPFTIVRHTRPEIAAEVERRLGAQPFDVAVAEQLQALSQLGPARRRGVPIVLRQQNVESDLWAGAAARGGRRAAWLRGEARRLVAWESRAVREVNLTLALSAPDAGRLRELAGGAAPVDWVAPPFPAALPAADHELPGAPPVVVLGSGGWSPNRDQARWFASEIWPAVRATRGGAILHLFGAERAAGDGIQWHGAPADSRQAFARGAVFTVPLRVGSGVRMKILEAWSRGVPVVATPQAASGLAAADGEELLLAGDGPSFAGAFGRLDAEPGLREAMVARGRSALRVRHDPAAVAAALVERLRAAAGAR
jgi:glycosyltransferase involved in cell wall biosynthesis